MRILLVCSGGMSTSLLVDAMTKTAADRGVTCRIQSGPASLVDEQGEAFDAILVAPQVRHRLAAIEEAARRHRVPVAVIPPEMYGKIQGDRLLLLVETLLAPNA